MTGSLDRLPRLLALVPYLLARPRVLFADVAAHFAVTEQQLREDLNLLWVCGLPGHGPGDLIDIEFEGETITLTEPAGVTRPLRLTADEALALVVALRALADTPGLVEHDAVLRALVKVEQAAGKAARLAGRVEIALADGTEGAAEPGALPVVRQALSEGRRLHLDYYVAGRDETTSRDIDPVRVLLVDGRSYLEAWDPAAESSRMFRLDRVATVTLLDERAEPPREIAQRDVSQGLYRPSETDLLVTLLVRPEASWVADYYPTESVEETAGGLVVRLRTPDSRWVRRLALRLGASGRVVAPALLAEQVRADARAALSGYAPDDPTG